MKNDSMKTVALSTIAALLLTVGVYHLALLMGANDHAPAFAAFAVFAVTAVFTPAFAAAFAVAVIVAFVAFAAAFTAVAVIVTVAVLIIAVAVAEQEHVRFRWVVPAYVVEGVAIWGALAVKSPGWSVAIVVLGIAALLVLWRLAPEPNAEEKAASVQDVQRLRITAHIAELESELAVERARLAALESPPTTEAALERNGA